MPLPFIVSCFSKIQIGFTLLVVAHRGDPGKRAIKRVCVWGGTHAHIHRWMDNNNNNNNNNHLTAVCLGQPEYARTRRNIHRLTPILVNVLPLSPFSICNGPRHPLYSAYVLDSPLGQPLSRSSLVFPLVLNP